MRITTWNVNGLRASFNKGFFDSVEGLDPDVLCLAGDQIPARAIGRELDCSKSSRPTRTSAGTRLSGLATAGRRPCPASLPETVELGLGEERFDGEGRVVASIYPDFWLFNIYFPNGQHDLGRVPFKLDFYARLLEICDELHQPRQAGHPVRGFQYRPQGN